MNSAESPPGLDLRKLASWLPAAIPGSGSDLSATLIAGGKSNLTYIVTDGEHSWILRRPPLGHVLATAHDMNREYRVMSALQKSKVPVPEMYAMCADDSVLGAPFYVMSKVEGVPYRSAIELEALGQHRTRAISERLIDTLVDLHEVDQGSGRAQRLRPSRGLSHTSARPLAQTACLVVQPAASRRGRTVLEVVC